MYIYVYAYARKETSGCQTKFIDEVELQLLEVSK